MEFVYKRAGLEDIELLVKTRIEEYSFTSYL